MASVRMSERRTATPAIFRTIGAHQTAPPWMLDVPAPAASYAFPRHGVSAPAPVAIETPVVETASVVASLPPPPPIPSVSPPAPSIPAPPPGPDPRLAEALVALASAREDVVARTREELVSLATEIARAILEVELTSRPELHRGLLAAALDVLGPGTAPRIRVAPDAFDAMVAGLGGRSCEVGGRRVEIEIDPTLEGNGVVLDAGDARVDASVDARLASVRAALLTARRTANREAA